jgi:hypothetical protein
MRFRSVVLLETYDDVDHGDDDDGETGDGDYDAADDGDYDGHSALLLEVVSA